MSTDPAPTAASARPRFPALFTVGGCLLLILCFFLLGRRIDLLAAERDDWRKIALTALVDAEEWRTRCETLVGLIERLPAPAQQRFLPPDLDPLPSSRPAEGPIVVLR